MSTESEHLSKLDSNAKQRYLEKISFINHVDPYLLKDTDFSDNIDSYPNVTYPDIVNYFLFAPSPLTKDQLKAYKALDSYNQFVSGWVINAGVKLFEKYVLIHGRVKHSQKMNDVPLHPWIISEKSGNIVCAHCNCMAGLGESCSHVGAVLFHIECAVKIRNSKTCTDEKAYWLLPSSKKIEFKPVSDIDFTSPKSLQCNLNNKVQGIIYDKKIAHRKSVSIPTKDETDKFFLDLSQCGTKPAILSIIPGFTKPYKPSIITEKYPESLSEKYIFKL
nr:uncharacterized protein LOC100211323 [Hydra vulgaris]